MTDSGVAKLGHLIRARWRSTTWRDLTIAIGFVLLAWISSGMVSIGINFYLLSFSRGNSAYVSNIAPAVCWSVMFLVPLVIYTWVKRVPWRWMLRKDNVLLLIGIGFTDCLGGFTATYSTVHTPMFLQTMLQSTGIIWTFGLTKLLVPTRAKPLSRWPVLSFALVIIGVFLAAIPQLNGLFHEHGNPVSQVAWLFIYLLAAVFPVCTNVQQGRYLVQQDILTRRRGLGEDEASVSPDEVADVNGIYAVQAVIEQDNISERSEDDELIQITHDDSPNVEDWPENPTVMKFMMLAGDCTIQVLFVTILFPLDFTPWFGSSPTPQKSWVGFVEGLECIFSCDLTGVYFLVYVLGFYLSHISMAFMNHYSPTLAAFVMAMFFPLNYLILWVVPALNINGVESPWYYNLPCFVCSFLGGTIYFLWSELSRVK